MNETDALLIDSFANEVVAPQTNNISSVIYQLIPESFYYGLRKELTQSRLELLADLAKKIPAPNLYGQFFNDMHYLKTLELLLLSTEETKHRKFFLMNEVLPRLYLKDRMLDIGIGNGEVTSLLARSFKHLTIIDNSYEALDCIKDQTHISKINASILDIKLPASCYDLILLSHVLYYVDKVLWVNIAHQLFDSLRPGGILVVVLNGDRGKAEMINQFAGRNLDMGFFIQQCLKKLNAKVEIYSSPEIFKAKDLNTMLHIAGLHLFDAQTTASQNELTHYLNKNNKNESGGYEISIYQKFVIITKPS